MSVESMAIVLHHSPSSGTEKVILLGIANHDGDGGAWPSVATLAKYANVNERAVQKCLAHLEASGQITRNIQQGGTLTMRNGQRPNQYILNLRCPEHCDRTTAHRDTRELQKKTPKDRGVPQDTPVLEDTPTPVLGDGGTPVLGDTQTTHEPSSEPSGSAALRAATAQPVETPASTVTSRNANARENRAGANSSSESSGDAPRATPQDILEAMMLNPDEATRFRAWLITAAGSRNPDGLIVALHGSGRLSERLSQWRASEAPFDTQVPDVRRPGHLAWCGQCDRQTRTAMATDAEGREYVRRCPNCNINTGNQPPGSGAARAIAALAASTDRTPGSGRAAFEAARANLPQGVARRTTTIGTTIDPATARHRAESEQHA